MRVLTIRQPWAWAIVHGGKDVENRVRNVAGSYRGPVAIHAALTGASFDAKHWKLWPFDERHVTGAIIGVVDLTDAHPAAAHYEPIGAGVSQWTDRPCCGEWAQRDCWHLKLANPRALTRSIPFKGALGLRTLPDDILAEIADLGFRKNQPATPSPETKESD